MALGADARQHSVASQWGGIPRRVSVLGCTGGWNDFDSTFNFYESLQILTGSDAPSSADNSSKQSLRPLAFALQLDLTLLRNLAAIGPIHLSA